MIAFEGSSIPIGLYRGTGTSTLAGESSSRTYPVEISFSAQRIATRWDLGNGEQIFELAVRPFAYSTPSDYGLFCRVFVVKGPLFLPAGHAVCSASSCQFSGALFGQSFNIVYHWDTDRQLLIKHGVRHKRGRPYSSWREEVSVA